MLFAFHGANPSTTSSDGVGELDPRRNCCQIVAGRRNGERLIALFGKEIDDAQRKRVRSVATSPCARGPNGA